MLLFKTISIPSGFNRKRLGELLKTYEKPDPKKVESFTSMGQLENLYQVHWVSPEEFDFHYFRYLEGRGYWGYVKAQTVRVKISGTSEEPTLLVRVLSNVWLSHLLSLAVVGALFVGALVMGFYSPKRDIDQAMRIFQLVGAYGVVFAISFFRVFNDPSVCETRLRHLVARDDWDPGAVKSVRKGAKEV
jgi:hypothetical protein